MVDKQTFSCSSVLGFQLCHGFGPSYGFQWVAIAHLMIAMLLQFFLLFVPSVESTTSYQYVTVPLLQPQSSQGVIISAPPQGRGQRVAAIEAL